MHGLQCTATVYRSVITKRWLKRTQVREGQQFMTGVDLIGHGVYTKNLWESEDAFYGRFLELGAKQYKPRTKHTFLRKALWGRVYYVQAVFMIELRKAVALHGVKLTRKGQLHSQRDRPPAVLRMMSAGQAAFTPTLR